MVPGMRAAPKRPLPRGLLGSPSPPTSLARQWLRKLPWNDFDPPAGGGGRGGVFTCRLEVDLAQIAPRKSSRKFLCI